MPSVSGVRPSGAVATVWKYRYLLRSLVTRDLKVKYQRSVLGLLWTLLNPLLTVVVLILVFSFVLRIQIEGYWAFLLSGFFVWNFISQSLSSATYVLAAHSDLYRNVPLHGEVLILSTVIFRLIEFLLELGLALAAVLVFHHGALVPSIVLLPLLILLLVLLALGLVFPLSTLSVFYADVQHALPVVLITLFYLSPVFYPADMIPASFRWLYSLNPMVGMLTLYQDVVYAGRFPPLSDLMTVAAVATGLCIAGYAVFRRYRNVFAEIV